jgi:hypothetical protein
MHFPILRTRQGVPVRINVSVLIAVVSDMGTIFQELHSATSHKILRLLLLATGAGAVLVTLLKLPTALELGFREFIPR